jgi:hypothetical protein
VGPSTGRLEEGAGAELPLECAHQRDQHLCAGGRHAAFRAGAARQDRGRRSVAARPCRQALSAARRRGAFPADSHLYGAVDQVRTGSYYLRPLGRPLVEGYMPNAGNQMKERNNDYT